MKILKFTFYLILGMLVMSLWNGYAKQKQQNLQNTWSGEYLHQ